MVTKIRRLNLSILILFIVGFAVVMVTNDHTVRLTDARSNGSPAARTGAPITATTSETTCTACHNQNPGPGQIQISAPPFYTPGQTVQIVVTQTTSDTSRLSWGFQLTALDTATNSRAGNLVATTLNTVVRSSTTRQYMNQTTAGTFPGQTGGATWTFNWTAPATSVGPITFYSAGLQIGREHV